MAYACFLLRCDDNSIGQVVGDLIENQIAFAAISPRRPDDFKSIFSAYFAASNLEH